MRGGRSSRRLKRLRKAGRPRRREGLLVQCGQRASCMFPTFAGLDGLLQLSQTIIPSARSSTWQIRSPAINTAMKWKSNPKELTEICGTICTCSLSQLRTTLSLDANTNERTTRACPTERGAGYYLCEEVTGRLRKGKKKITEEQVGAGRRHGMVWYSMDSPRRRTLGSWRPA